MRKFDYSKFIGFKYNGYEIKEKVGAGFIGVVFRARHEERNLDCALKIIPKAEIIKRKNWEQEIQSPWGLPWRPLVRFSLFLWKIFGSFMPCR